MMRIIRGKGFTLVELLVVLVIIGILVALILPAVLRAIHQAEVRECQSNVRTINTAIRMFYTDTRTWAPVGAVGPAYLAPAANGVNYFPDGVPVCNVGGVAVAYATAANADGSVQVNTAGHVAGAGTH